MPLSRTTRWRKKSDGTVQKNKGCHCVHVLCGLFSLSFLHELLASFLKTNFHVATLAVLYSMYRADNSCSFESLQFQLPLCLALGSNRFSVLGLTSQSLSTLPIPLNLMPQVLSNLDGRVEASDQRMTNDARAPSWHKTLTHVHVAALTDYLQDRPWHFQCRQTGALNHMCIEITVHNHWFLSHTSTLDAGLRKVMPNMWCSVI